MSTYQIIGLTYLAVGLLSCLAIGLEYSRKKTFDLRQLPMTHALVWVARILVGLLFIYSGYVKANDYIGFGYKLEEYFYVFNMPFFVPYAETMAWFISVFEIALAFAILLGFRMPQTAWLALLMMIFFTWLTGYSHFTGKVTDCGCFGDALKIEPWESFTKDLILMLLLIPVFLTRKSIRPIPSEKVAVLVVLASFLLSGAYAYWCHENLPLVDYRPYKVGVDLRQCTTQPGPDGIPKCKDWYLSFFDEADAFEPFEGNTLMIVMYYMDEAPEMALRQSVELAQSLPEDVRVVAMTNTSPSTVESMIQRYQMPYPFAFLDETVLKTIIRSSPGYVLLEDGIIQQKWHYNNLPSAEEIQELLR